MSEKTLLKRLENLIPDLEYGQETHRIWRDCDQKYRDAEPSLGDKDFHIKLVDTYENRILTVKDAIEQLSHCQDSITKYIQSTSELLGRIEAKDNDLKAAKHIIGKQNSELDGKDKLIANSVHTVKISSIISKNNFARSKDALIILDDLREILTTEDMGVNK